MADNEEEVDLFDLSIQAPRSGMGHGEMETNAMSIEFDSAKSEGLRPGVPVKIPSLMSGVSEDEAAVFETAIVDRADIAAAESDPVDGLTESSVFELSSAPVFGAESDTIDGLTESSVFEMASSPAAEPEPAREDEQLSDFHAEYEAVDNITESSIFEIAPVEVDEDVPDFERQEHRFETVTVPAVGGDYDPSGESDSEASEVAVAPEATPEPLPPPVFNKIAHVCLHVKNLEASSEFYTRLGFKKRFSFNRDGERFGAYFEFGKGNFIELFEILALDNEPTRGGFAHFCLETPDIDETMASLDSRGIEYTPKKLGCDATYQIWLKDPDGYEFEVHQYTDDSSQLVGRDVDADW